MSEEGAGICYCKLPENVERNENALAEAIEAYSEMIKKQEMDLHCLKETGPCDPIDHNRCSSVSNAKESLSLAYNERGQLKYLLVDFHGAVQDYSMAIELVRENATSLYNRGQIYYRLGNFKDAIHDFHEALKHREDFNDARLGLQASKKAMGQAMVK